MRTAKVLFFLCSIFFIHLSYAQGEMEWLEKEYNFGQIKEEGGYAEHTFNFVNKGNDSLKITYVKASCGCTTPSWSRDFIAPGDTGFVMARYNPFNRPGPFKKSLNVKTSEGGNDYLYIKGTVTPRPKTIEEKLPEAIGNLRFRFKSLNVGRITTEKTVNKTFEIYNESDSQIIVKEILAPDYAKMSLSNDTIDAKTSVELYVKFDPENAGELGFYSDNIQLMTTDKELPIKNLDLVASITEYFPPMSDEELEKAPRLFIDDANYNFGSLSTTSEKETTIQLLNNGASKLNIRKVAPNCDCIEVDLNSENIKPGKSAELKVAFKGKGRQGRQYKTITVYSNDPLAPTQVISIRADVK